jgi:predicted outer membrane protein
VKNINNFIHSRAFIVMLVKTRQGLLDEFKKDPKKFDATYLRRMSKGLNETLGVLKQITENSNELPGCEFSDRSPPVMQRHLQTP